MTAADPQEKMEVQDECFPDDSSEKSDSDSDDEEVRLALSIAVMIPLTDSNGS